MGGQGLYRRTPDPAPVSVQSPHRIQLPWESIIQEPESVSSPFSSWTLTSSTGTPRSRDRASDMSHVKSQTWERDAQHDHTRPCRLARVSTLRNGSGRSFASLIS